jgi:hypothetical protein
VLSGNLERTLWPKFAGIRLLLSTSLDGRDRERTLHHCTRRWRHSHPQAGDTTSRDNQASAHDINIDGRRIHSRHSPPIYPRQHAFTPDCCTSLSGHLAKDNAPLFDASDLHPCSIQDVDRAPACSIAASEVGKFRP